MARDLKSHMLDEAHAFSFFQVVRLLRAFGDEGGKTGRKTAEVPDNISLRPELSMAFQPSDVERIEQTGTDAREHFEVTVNFMGLYGTSSPLPTFYTEDLLDEFSRDETVTRDFLDIFNHHLLAQFYRCWSKYRQHIQVVENENHHYTERLFALLGFGDPRLCDHIPQPERLLRYIGLFSQSPRSAAGLKTLLQDVFEGVPVTVFPCIEREATIPEDQRFLLGASMCHLGADSYLGQEIKDRNGKFRIRIGPVSQEVFQRFSPGSEDFETVSFLTRLYVVDPLEYDLELILEQGEAKCARLGHETQGLLGMNTWTFSSEKIDEVTTIFSPQTLEEHLT